MNLWKKINRLLGLGAWPEANPRNVELRVHPRRGADLRVGSKDFPHVMIKGGRKQFLPYVQKYGRALRKGPGK